MPRPIRWFSDAELRKNGPLGQEIVRLRALVEARLDCPRSADGEHRDKPVAGKPRHFVCRECGRPCSKIRMF